VARDFQEDVELIEIQNRGGWRVVRRCAYCPLKGRAIAIG
jgi:hypothetical protein